MACLHLPLFYYSAAVGTLCKALKYNHSCQVNGNVMHLSHSSVRHIWGHALCAFACKSLKAFNYAKLNPTETHAWAQWRYIQTVSLFVPLFPRENYFFFFRETRSWVQPGGSTVVGFHDVWQSNGMVVSELEKAWNEHTSCYHSLMCALAKKGKWYLQLRWYFISMTET